MPLEDDPSDIDAAEAVGGKPGIGAGIDPLEIIGRPLRGGDRAEEAAEIPEHPDLADTKNGAGNDGT